MKKQKLFCAAAILSLALSLPVYAGDVQTPTVTTPPPPPPTITTNGMAGNPSLNGDMDSPRAGDLADTSSDLFIELLFAAFSLY
jgi:hypothetical protein